MLRNDRKLTEQMISDGAIKVLCCIAILAWGKALLLHCNYSLLQAPFSHALSRR